MEKIEMNHIPEGIDMEPTYENFTAHCPWCGHENKFNRASDLKDSAPIDHRDVACFACSKPFYLTSDVISPAYEMMIIDCHELRERKHYAYCILNLAQAFEVFFSQYLLIDMLYKSFASDPDKDIDRLNRLIELLYNKTEKLSFNRMRNLFFFCVLDAARPTSLVQAEEAISRFPDEPPWLPCPSDQDIRTANISADIRIRDLLLRVKYCKAPALRNQVVHQRAYRPTLDEVNDTLKETREILFVLPHALEVRNDDINFYCRTAK
jgi:hypothetical protein